MTKITYQNVARICNEMKLHGETPSVRKIRERTGGSFTTISDYLKQWREETERAETVETRISEELTNAILAEFHQVAHEASSHLQKKLDEKEVDLTETREALTEYEARCRKQELTIDELKTKLHNSRIEHEKKQAALESSIEFLKDREGSLQKLLSEANQKRHEAELKEAVANTKVEALEKRAGELEQQLKKQK